MQPADESASGYPRGSPTKPVPRHDASADRQYAARETGPAPFVTFTGHPTPGAAAPDGTTRSANYSALTADETERLINGA